MSMALPPAIKIAVVAGEASGDALGASALRALRAKGIAVEAIGVGGATLEAEGLRSLFPQSDINVMGVAAVAQRLPTLLRRISQTAGEIAAAQPDLLLTIDSPDFSLRVAKKVRALAPRIPIAHWVCPSVWAWRPGRARRMAPHVDRVLCLLPFEPAELRKLDGPHGVYVGHPLIERLNEMRPQADGELASRSNVQSPEILLLPGSRRSEVSRLMPVLDDIATRILAQHPGARFTLPAVDHARPIIDEAARAWRTPVTIVAGEAAKLAAFRRARAALAASGTVTLELALSCVPLIGVYRVAQWEAIIGQYLIRAHSALLPNLVLGRNAIPEFLQWHCAPDLVAATLSALIKETPERQAQLAAFEEIAERMQSDGAAPSAHVADEILGMIY